MAHGQEYTQRQQGIINRYYDNRDSIMLQKLGEIVSEIYLCSDAKKADKLWESAKTSLTNTQANRVRVDKLVAERNVEELARVLNELTVPAKKSQASPTSMPTAAIPASVSKVLAPQSPNASSPQPSSPATAPTPDDLKAALKAFRKRLKLTRLDEESRLGRSPMSKGAPSGIVAVMPPNQYPRAVWDELVRQGKLRYAGSGCYELLEP